MVERRWTIRSEEEVMPVSEHEEATAKMRDALEALTHYLAEPHKNIGEPCGVDACIVCLALSTVKSALKGRGSDG